MNLYSEEKVLRDFPWLEQLKGKLHNAEHHPEGDAFRHTMSCLSFVKSHNQTIYAAVANHDYGKAFTYQFREGKGHTYYGHDLVGAKKIVEVMQNYADFNEDVIEACRYCCEKHMLMHPKPIRQLRKTKLLDIVNNKNWPILKEVAYCDEMSRLHLANEKRILEDLEWAEQQKTIN